jgi:type II restriction/modification system DNA methylase subunit YeeA
VLNAFTRADAILTQHPDGSVTEPEWPTVDFIVWNPPFLGDKMMRSRMGDDYVTTLRAHYDGRVPGGADLCCYWFEKARAHVEAGRCKRVGLLATQGIRGGLNREVLKRITRTGDIFFAVSDRERVLDGANLISTKRTLTNLYNDRHAWLANAHRALDEAVFAAYGWPPSLTDDELLARLLDLNLAQSAAEAMRG